MSSIKFLDDNIINRIAAGEVVERPASVVKELVENAIDAGATKIDIILEKGGKQQIIVSDNGIGIDSDELPLAVARHATSKLANNDIFNLNYMGFRGEALASIASVSNFSIASSKHNSDIGHVLNVDNGVIGTIEPCKPINGTKIEVNNLFNALPARLKFLKSDTYENKQVVDVFIKLALANPNINFTLTCDDKNLYRLSKTENFFARFKQIFSEYKEEDFATIDVSSGEYQLYGAVGVASLNRASTDHQFIYVNNRPVRDKTIALAIKLAYKDLIANNRYPIILLFLNIPNYDVDINVHPSKLEVRFGDVNYIRNFILQSLNDALKNISRKSSESLAQNIIENKIFFESQSKRENLNLNEPRSNAFQYVVPLKYSNSTLEKFNNNYAPDLLVKEKTIENIEEEEENKTNPNVIHPDLGYAKCQIATTYIISETSDSLVITDQHAACERILYEKIKKEYNENNVARQLLLTPEIIEINAVDKEIVTRHHKTLEQLGFKWNIYGKPLRKLAYNEKMQGAYGVENRSVCSIHEDSSRGATQQLPLEVEFTKGSNENSLVLSEAPALLINSNIKFIFQSLLVDLHEEHSISFSSLKEHILETIACHNSIRSGRKLNVHEMNEILNDIKNTENSAQCNHGRPTYIKFSFKEIEKFFGRS